MSIRPAFGMLLVAALFLGCGKKKAEYDPPLTPVTDAEAKEFGKHFLAAIEAKDRAQFDKLMRLEEFGHRTVADLKLDMETETQYVKSMESDFAEIFETFTTAHDPLFAKVIVARTRDGKLEVSLRLASLQYAVFTLARHPDGNVVMKDWTPTNRGDPQSLTSRKWSAPFNLNRKGRGGSSQITSMRPQDALYLQHHRTVEAVGVAVEDKDYSKAWELLEGLPTELKNEKWIAQMRVNLTQLMDESTAHQEIERFLKLFPEDNSLVSAKTSYWLAKGDFKRGLEVIARLDAFVGGDPHLNSLRIPLYLKAERYAEAKTAAEQLLAAEPNLTDSYAYSARVAAKTGDYAGAAERLKTIVTKLSGTLDFDYLPKEPAYEDFVETQEYDDLKKWYEARPKE